MKQVAGADVIARQAIPAPAQFLAELERGENKASTDAYYSHTDDLITDIANAYKAAILAFYEAGCRSLQLDDCTWGMLCDKNYWEARQQEGADVAEIAKLYARVNQEAITGLPSDLIITTQICLSPQCGFASTEEGNILTEEQQWSKLTFIKEIADEIWK